MGLSSSPCAPAKPAPEEHADGSSSPEQAEACDGAPLGWPLYPVSPLDQRDLLHLSLQVLLARCGVDPRRIRALVAQEACHSVQQNAERLESLLLMVAGLCEFFPRSMLLLGLNCSRFEEFVQEEG